mmetsp:Transcript_44739/g.97203  ORF Transcript_44739/g.97203 Transcript_44739/m.97203 type:complete len:323 (-) Transcript_44739:812-1780(-)
MPRPEPPQSLNLQVDPVILRSGLCRKQPMMELMEDEARNALRQVLLRTLKEELRPHPFFIFRILDRDSLVLLGELAMIGNDLRHHCHKLLNHLGQSQALLVVTVTAEQAEGTDDLSQVPRWAMRARGIIGQAFNAHAGTHSCYAVIGAKIGFHHPQCLRNFQLCVRILGKYAKKSIAFSAPGARSWAALWIHQRASRGFSLRPQDTQLRQRQLCSLSPTMAAGSRLPNSLQAAVEAEAPGCLGTTPQAGRHLTTLLCSDPHQLPTLSQLTPKQRHGGALLLQRLLQQVEEFLLSDCLWRCTLGTAWLLPKQSLLQQLDLQLS